jgi:oxaloacetate decarboxylase (Na+ extruding) subunit alpha
VAFVHLSLSRQWTVAAGVRQRKTHFREFQAFKESGTMSEKGVRSMSEKKVMFSDTTFRDGAQSLWAMKMQHGMYDAVASEMDQAGYSFIELPMHAAYLKMAVRTFKEDPWKTMHMFKNKITKTRKMCGIANCIDLIGESEPRSVIKMWHRLKANAVGSTKSYSMANTRNELDRHFPWLIPMIRDLGQEVMPAICYYPSPRTTDEYYAGLTKRLMEYKPDALMLKDAGGLLSVERIKTLLPAIMKEANGVAVELHTHGMSTFQGAVVVEAMKLGIGAVHTCVPPLASGSSHVSIFNAMHNAKLLGIKTSITNVEALKVVEERLTRIAKLENLPIGVPLEYDHGVYTHQVPGGVISNLRAQLGQLGIAHKLEEVLEEVVRIIKDLGYPIMITPASQFIVSQAAVNVATGERYKEVLDCMVETALGVWGWEDAGVPWMDPNVKDKFLSQPSAKKLAEKYARDEEEAAKEGSVHELRAKYGMTHASDEEFMLYHIMRGDAEIKKIGPPKSWYTGKKPLVLLLKELSKDRDISSLQMQKGNTFFEFRRN